MVNEIDSPSNILGYFTKNGAERVKNDYSNLIGQTFRFNKNIEDKSTLVFIQILPAGPEDKGGHGVSFISDNNQSLMIYEFFQLNKIKSYRFEDYEHF